MSSYQTIVFDWKSFVQVDKCQFQRPVAKIQNLRATNPKAPRATLPQADPDRPDPDRPDPDRPDPDRPDPDRPDPEKTSATLHGAHFAKSKTSATLHGSAPQKWKTSATLHGNAFFVSMVQQGLPNGAPLKPSKPFKINCLGRFLELHWSSRCGDQKNGRAQMDAKERPSGGCKVLIFPIYFEYFCLLRPRIFFKKCKNTLVL